MLMVVKASVVVPVNPKAKRVICVLPASFKSCVVKPVAPCVPLVIAIGVTVACKDAGVAWDTVTALVMLVSVVTVPTFHVPDCVTARVALSTVV